jgi:thymidylate kinase
MTAPNGSALSRCHAGMVVEFSGVTGVGKTTLVRTVKEALRAQGFSTWEAQEAIVSYSFGNDFNRFPKLQSFLVQVLAIVPFLRFLGTRQGRRLSRLALHTILRDAGNFRIAISLLRNFAKRVGSDLHLKDIRHKLQACDFILCDEGTLQAAHNLFVHVDSCPRKHEIEFFARNIPKPDLVVWVKAPKRRLVARLLQRGHQRVRRRTREATAFIENATVVFDKLFSLPPFQRGSLIIDGPILAVPTLGAMHERGCRIADVLKHHLRDGVEICSASSPGGDMANIAGSHLGSTFPRYQDDP